MRGDGGYENLTEWSGRSNIRATLQMKSWMGMRYQSKVHDQQATRQPQIWAGKWYDSTYVE